ncbi:MAG: YCF48-related protein, partial [Ideonella sp.]
RSGASAWSLGRDAATQAWVLSRSVDLGITFKPTALRLPASALVVGVEFADDLHGWVMTSIPNPNPNLVYPERETFWRTSDGGATWVDLGGTGLARGPLFEQPPAIEFFNDSIGIASNSVCGMLKVFRFYRTLDGASSWQLIDGPPDRQFQDLTAVSSSAAWTSGQSRCGIPPPNRPPQRGVFLTRDLGTSWQYLEVADEPIDSSVRAVLIADDQSIQMRYARQTYRSADGGQTWTKVWPAATTQFESASGRYAVAFATPLVGMAVSASGRLLRSTDGGRTWQVQAAEKAADLTPQTPSAADQRGRIQMIDADHAWVAGRNSIQLFSNGAANWIETLTAFDNSTPRDLFFASAEGGWAIKSSGYDASTNPARIWSTADAGRSWQEQARLDFAPNGLHFADRMLGLVVGAGGAILRTADSGVSWSRQVSGTSQDLYRVRFVDATSAWAVGAPGAGLRVSRDAGLSWQPVMLGSPHAWNGLHFVDPMRGWIVGDFGSIASTRDGGATWQPQDSGTDEHLFDVFGIDAETVWTVGERGVIRASATGGD